jgi:hypothetical protein
MKRTLPIIALAVILLSAPAGLLLRKATGEEPYPALFMPGFGLVPGPHHIDNFEVFALTALTSSGAVTEVDIDRLLPSWGPYPQILARRLFAQKDRMRTSEACVWLTRRLASVYPGRRYVAAEARWALNSKISPSRSGSGAVAARMSYSIDLRACQ